MFHIKNRRWKAGRKCFFTTVYPVLSESEYLVETGESISGLAAIEYNQKKATKQTDYLTDEYVYEAIKDILAMRNARKPLKPRE